MTPIVQNVSPFYPFDENNLSKSNDGLSSDSAIRNSNKKAFKKVYFEYFQPLYRFILLQTGSCETAKDLTQDVFTRLWLHRSKLEIHTSLRAYLYRAAYNAVIDFRRSEEKKKTYCTELLEEHKQVHFQDSIENRTALQIAISKLPENIRLIYILSRYQGLKYAEISETCKISIRTIEERIKKALQLLRKELL